MGNGKNQDVYVELFGLTKERCKELQKIAVHLVQKSEKIPYDFMTALEERKDLSTREIIFMSLITGKAIGFMENIKNI